MSHLTQRLRAGWRRLARLAHLDDRVADSAHASAVAAARLEAKLELLIREQRLLALQATLPPSEAWAGGPRSLAHDPASPPFTSYSAVCRQESFDSPWFAVWADRLGFAPRYHRKLWEYAFIGQALEERGVLRSGARGLGFGVGREPLGAYFASLGCQVLATDMAADEGSTAWSATGQYASGKEALRHPDICPADLFEANVTFRACDMNAIPDDLTGFDFCWSACALEHLGSLEAGLRFVERTLTCLAPGGVAVHTTELNLNDDDATLTSGPTVLYRRRDLEAFASQVAAKGYRLAPLDFDTGTGTLDRYVDMPPYLQAPHLRLAIEGYPSTSIALIVEAPPAP